MISLFKVFMSEEAKSNVQKVINSGYIGQGPVVEEFEGKLKKYINNENLITANSGTSAAHLAYRLIKDELEKELFKRVENFKVLTTPLTCFATTVPILANGFDIKWVDINPKTLLLDYDDLRRKIDETTRVISIVHWGGFSPDLRELQKIQDETYDKFGFYPYIVHDCAHAFGSEWESCKMGDIELFDNCCVFMFFSFQAIKNLEAGDGGMLVCSNDEDCKKAKLLRWYGLNREVKGFRIEEDVKDWGYKFHMNDINASIGLGNLEHINWILTRHRENAKYYDERFEGKVLTQKRHFFNDPSYWLYTIFVEDVKEFTKEMTAAGIQVSPVHSRNDRHTCVQQYRCFLPSMDSIENHYVAIPVGWWLKESERNYIADMIIDGKSNIRI